MTELLPLMTYCFVMSSTPGPNNIMLTASGANFGYRGTLPQIMGINVGGFVQTYVTCLGLGALFVAWPMLQVSLRVAGALYLLVGFFENIQLFETLVLLCWGIGAALVLVGAGVGLIGRVAKAK